MIVQKLIFLPMNISFEYYPSFTNSGNSNSGLYNLVCFCSIFMLGLGSILRSVSKEVFDGTMTSNFLFSTSYSVSMGSSNTGLISNEERMDLYYDIFLLNSLLIKCQL